MTDNVYAVSEIVGTSKVSVEDAIQGAVAAATKRLRHLDWFEVRETRGHIADGKVAHFQVVLKVGFRYDDD